MAYTRAWDETKPPGTDLANTLDTIIQNKTTDIRERVAGIFGLNLAQFSADPIVPISLTLSGALVAGSFSGPITGALSGPSLTITSTLLTPVTITSNHASGTVITIDNTAGASRGSALGVYQGGAFRGYFGVVGLMLGTVSSTLALWAGAGIGLDIYTNNGVIALSIDTIQNVTVAQALVLSPTKRLYLDGGSDTYILESSANRVDILTAGILQFGVAQGLVLIPATNKFYLDGGSDTYINEPSANVLSFVTGGAEAFRATTTAFVMLNSFAFGWSGRAVMQSPADGQILLTDNAGTNFTYLYFGGTTVGFPLLKRVGAGLAVRTGNDVSDAALSCSTLTGNVTGNVIGNVTGNVTGSSGSTTGNAATATALQTARAINGVNFDGTGAITVAAAAGTLTGAALAAGVTSSSLTSFGAGAAITGNAGTATTLQAARNINGVSFNGSADITVAAAAGTLTGTTLAAGVTASSLTSHGTLTNLTVNGTITQLQATSKFIIGATLFSFRDSTDVLSYLTIDPAIGVVINTSLALRMGTVQDQFGNAVVGNRRTGWAAPTATLSRTAIANADTLATTISHLAALVTDIESHGMIGA